MRDFLLHKFPMVISFVDLFYFYLYLSKFFTNHIAQLMWTDCYRHIKENILFCILRNTRTNTFFKQISPRIKSNINIRIVIVNLQKKIFLTTQKND